MTRTPREEQATGRAGDHTNEPDLLSFPGLTSFGDPDAGACVDGVCAVPEQD